jgi:integrase
VCCSVKRLSDATPRRREKCYEEIVICLLNRLNTTHAKEVCGLLGLVMEVVNGCTIDPSKRRSLDDFFRQVYLVNVESEKKPSTLAGYRKLFDQQISPRCGSEYLKDFDTPRMQQFLRQVSKENPNLKRTSMRNIKCLMSAIFRHAIQQGYITGVNPVRETSLPLSPEGTDTFAYSLDEVLAIVHELSEPARTICAVAAFAGLRRSEIQGLTWEPYLASGAESLRVERSFVNGQWGEPKTKSSRAWVPVIPPLQRLLNAHRIRCGSPTSGLMFATGRGTPLCLNNTLNREILPALNRCKVCDKPEHEANGHAFERNGLLPVWHGWHSFRRGLATNLHDLGVDDMTIQQILRHSNVAVTQASYIKTLPKQTAAAMSLLSDQVEAQMRPTLLLNAETV